MPAPIEMKRNVAVAAHTGAGKTTLAEAMLFGAKATKKLTRPADGSSILDTDPEEQKRTTTISSSLHHYTWQKHDVTVIDTPGDSNFLSETRSSIRVADGAVLILSAISGVKVQTERIFQFTDESKVPRLAFVNKMDHERAEFMRPVRDLEKVLEVKGIPLQLPMGHGETFGGAVDLLQMKALSYADDSSGVVTKADIPEELAGEAAAMREALIEAIAETDDALTEKFLEGEALTDDEIIKGLRDGVLSGKIVPVLCGSALKNIGITPLLDAINTCLPAPADRGPVKGKDPSPKKEGEEGAEAAEGAEGANEVIREVSAEAPFSAFVFKTIIDPYAGRLSIAKVCSGTLTHDTALLNPANDSKEKASHILLLEGAKTSEVKEASAGDIVALPKLKNTHTSDTLTDPAEPIVFDRLPHSNAALSFAIEPATKADDEKVPQAMAKLLEEDPSLEFRREDETGEFMLSGVGQVHLEVSVEKLKRKFGCSVILKAPRIPYKETIRTSVKVQGRYKKQSGGHGQYGDTWIEFSPLPKGSGFEFENNIVGGVIPRSYIPAVEKGLREAMRKGVLAGQPVVDFKARLYDGSHHSVDSSEMAFKIAASMGFKKGMEQARPVLLEPIMQMNILVPDENMGDVIGDLNSRRGKVQGVESKRGSQNIAALVPMAEIVNYASDLKGMTHDRGFFTMEFSKYEELPSHLSKKVVDATKTEKEKS